MFGKKEEFTSKIDSLIGENTKIIGKIEGSGSLRIDGFIEGDIDYNGDIIIGETGKVEGNISCNNLSLSGKVKGNINSKSNLTILPKGNLVGDTEVASLIIHENASFNGNCKMKNENNHSKITNLEEKVKDKSK
ncbi:cytoskeletal protein CcmA (bactofilin family) [Keratinibaculum paraultunense]|uniref:Cytoskeletal protein CcmA (Bactofilin family) n=1 Tax=Keratinibaculum paraultunense TaxID=1278232 RepID=A0A4R3KRJ4_9FIRM|nr:polymer-forming cytoskeletal protein [Keratinibaculum paraultunense]QQY79599.1 polymer-forming cytoskeletal protein [Keratinibaculum paraultunense]TCS87622.1 cytoskeletal protein CcmA (bactofilin family) [Keratinibaculum paraultunense]